MKLTGRVIGLSLLGLATSLTVQAQNSLQKVDAVPGEYVVRLKPQAMGIQSVNALSQSLGAYVKSSIPSHNIVVVKRPVFETTYSAVKSLANNPLVDVAEPNYIYKINKTPNDPMFGQLWGMSNAGQKDSEGHAGVAGVDIGVEKAWDIETGSEKMVVAVIDTGIDFNHPDLKDNLWTNEAEAKGKPGVDDDGNGVIDDIHGFNAITGNGNAMDDQGHGSHCAGTIGAKGNDGKGIVGVNWNVKLMAVKFLDANGSGSLEDAIKAIDYATKMGAKVMSNSWGGGSFSQTLFDSIKATETAGALFIAAAGNDGSNNDSAEAYPANYNTSNMISVAAIDNAGARANFSNYGKNKVHLAAPGVNIYSSTGGKYDSWSGTSMATPHVSGVAALVWSHEQNMDAVAIKQRLLSTVKPLASLRGKVKTGGMVNAYNALVNKNPEADPNDPANWQTKDVNYSSPHPYEKNSDIRFEIKVPGAKEIALYFEKFDTEGIYDTMELYAGNGARVEILSGNNDETFSSVIPGDTVKVVFKSDGSVEKDGWKISKVAYR